MTDILECQKPETKQNKQQGEREGEKEKGVRRGRKGKEKKPPRPVFAVWFCAGFLFQYFGQAGF